MFGTIYSISEDGHIFALVNQSEWDSERLRQFIQAKKDAGYIVYQLGSKPWSKEIYINFTNLNIPEWFTSIL